MKTKFSSLLKKFSLLGFVGTLFLFSTSATQAQVGQSEIVNALNLVRGSLSTKEVPNCGIRLGFCPIISANCPGSHPLCRSVRVRHARGISTFCKCANGVSAGYPVTDTQFVEPCPSGTSCAAVPVTLATPKPTPTPRPTVTPRATATPRPGVTPGVVSYIQATNTRTGQTAKNGGTINAIPGDAINYSWFGAYSGVTGGISKVSISGLNGCGGPRRGEIWVANMGASGGTGGVVQPCQAGSLYTISYQPVNSSDRAVGLLRTVKINITAN